MKFFYEALDQNGQTVLGKIDADDVTEAHLALQKQGYRPQALAPQADQTATPFAETQTQTATALALPQTAPRPVPPAVTTQNALANPNTTKTVRVTLTGQAARTAPARNESRVAAPASMTLQRAQNGSKLGGVSTRDLMFFFRQLAALVRSGMTIYASLDNLAARTPNANLAMVGREMAEAAHRGDRVSDVMDAYPRIFPDHLVGMVRAGELGGFLEISLAEIAHDYEQNIALYRGSWIPKLMATQAFFMLPLAIPLFTTLFRSLDFKANFIAYLQQVGLIYLPLFGALYLLIRWGANRLQLPQYRYLRDGWALKMPPFGDLQRQVGLANFVRVLRRLTHAGVAPIHAWEGAMYTAYNVVIRDRLVQSYNLMQRGTSFAEAFQATGLFHNSIEQLIVTGQQSGQLVEMLDQAADYYQELVEESSRKAKFAMLRFGILAMLILGGATLLWLVRSYFAALFHFADNFETLPGFIFPSGR